jgi:SAM-dependent methyltransferase
MAARARPLAVSVGEACSLPIGDASADAVLCLGVLDHVTDQAAAVAELVRIARPGALVLVSFPNRHSPYAWWSARVWRPAIGRVRRDPSPTPGGGPATATPAALPAGRLRSRREAVALLAAAGTLPVGTSHVGYNPLLPPLDQLLPRLALLLTRRGERLHRGRLAALGSSFVVAARRDDRPMSAGRVHSLP